MWNVGKLISVKDFELEINFIQCIPVIYLVSFNLAHRPKATDNTCSY